MRPETKLSDYAFDERAGLPSNKLFVALAALGVLLLVSAAVSSTRVTSPPQRVPVAAKAVTSAPYTWEDLETSLDR